MMFEWLWPQHCEHTKVYEEEQSRGNQQQRKNKWPWEDVGGQRRESQVRAKQSQKVELRAAEKERHSTGECLRPRGTRASEEASRNAQSTAHAKMGTFPSFYHWGSSCTTLKLDFKASSPLSHELTEIQPETDLHLAVGHQASETQTCELMTTIGGGWGWVHKAHDFFIIDFTHLFFP